MQLMFIGPSIILIVEQRETNLMSLAFLFHYLTLNIISDVIMSILGSLRLIC